MLTNVAPELLPTYSVILLAGDIEFDDAFLGELEKSLRRGSLVLMAARHKAALGAQFDRVARHGNVEVLESWVNPETKRPTAISNARLTRLAHEMSPIEVGGDAIQYQINRTQAGWVVELVNNRGVIKVKDKPAVIDPNAVAYVTLKSVEKCATAKEWRTGRSHSTSGEIVVELGPGQTEFVEFIQGTSP